MIQTILACLDFATLERRLVEDSTGDQGSMWSVMLFIINSLPLPTITQKTEVISKSFFFRLSFGFHEFGISNFNQYRIDPDPFSYYSYISFFRENCLPSESLPMKLAKIYFIKSYLLIFFSINSSLATIFLLKLVGMTSFLIDLT